MIYKYYQVNSESSLKSKDFEEGSLYFCEDTKNIYLDPIGKSTRIHVGGMSMDEVKELIDKAMLTAIW